MHEGRRLSIANLKKNFAYQITYNLLTILTPIITSPLLSRALGAEKLGIYSATIAFSNYFTLFAMLGVETYGSRVIASAQREPQRVRELFWDIYAIQFGCSVAAIALYYACFRFIPAERRMVAFAQGLWVFASLLNVNWLFYGLEQFKLIVTRNIACKILAVAAIALLIRKPQDLPLYAFIMSGDALLSSAAMWPFLRGIVGTRKPPNFSQARRHIVPILTLFVPILALSLYHIMDKTMLDLFSAEREAGFYYNADKMINIPLGIVTALNAVMLPRMSYMVSAAEHLEVQRMLKKSMEVSMFLLGGVAIGIASVANEFVPFFFGPGFEPCVLLVHWFIPVMFVKVISALIRSQYMIPTHMDKEYLFSVFGGAIANLFANLLLIRRYGALGAVWGTLTAEAVVMITELLCTMRTVPFIRYAAENLPYLLMAAVMFLSIRKAASLIVLAALPKLLCMIALGGFVYLSLCAVYWRLNRNSVFHDALPALERRWHS